MSPDRSNRSSKASRSLNAQWRARTPEWQWSQISCESSMWHTQMLPILWSSQVVQVGVDPVTHANMQSEATSAITNARAETAAVFCEAEAVIQSLRSENQQLGSQAAAIQGEAQAAIQALRSENQPLGSQASAIQGEAETVVGISGLRISSWGI